MRIAAAAGLLLLVATPAFAAGREPPPPDAKPLSQIIADVEKRPNFAYVDAVDYARGAYMVIYYMKDGAEVRMEIDAKTGQMKK